MIYAAVGDTTYHLLLWLHIIAIVGAFGPTLLFPVLVKEANKEGGELGQRLAGVTKQVTQRTFLPGMIVAALLGVALSAHSDTAYEISAPWISASFMIVIVLAALTWFLLRPAQNRMMAALAKGEDGRSELRSSRAMVGAMTGIIHLGLVVIIALMIWKPGNG